jgi:tetratricopeptide (TPR) repeat protein
MHRIQSIMLILCAMALLEGVALFAQTSQPALPTEAEVGSRDPTVRKKAILALRNRLNNGPRAVTTEIYNRRLPDYLQEVGEFEAAAEVSLRCINAQPDRIERAEYFLAARAKALLAAKNYQEALPAAKSYYNVCLIKTTPKAIELVAQALAAAHPDDPGLPRRFKLQQLAGGTVLRFGDALVPAVSAGSGAKAAETAAATGDISLGEDVLRSIQVDGSIYDGEGFELERNPDAQWLGKANMLLMQDKPEEALAIFERLTKASNVNFSGLAKTGLARAIKASDGNLTKANEYLGTLQP